MRKAWGMLIMILVLLCGSAVGENLYAEGDWMLVSDSKCTWRYDLTDGTAERLCYDGNASGFYDLGDRVLFSTRDNSAWSSDGLWFYDKSTHKADLFTIMGEDAEILGLREGLVYYRATTLFDGSVYVIDPMNYRSRNDREHYDYVEWAGMDENTLALIRKNPDAHGTDGRQFLSLTVQGLETGTVDGLSGDAGDSALISGGELFYTEYDLKREGQWIVHAKAPWQDGGEKLLYLKGPESRIRFAGLGSGWVIFRGDALADYEDALFLLNTKTGELQTVDTNMGDQADLRLLAFRDGLCYVNGAGELRTIRPEAGAETELQYRFPAGAQVLGFCRDQVFWRLDRMLYASSLTAEKDPVSGGEAGTKAIRADLSEIAEILKDPGVVDLNDSPILKFLKDDPEISAVLAAIGETGTDIRLQLKDENGTDVSLHFGNTADKSWTLETDFTAGGQEGQAFLSADEAQATLKLEADGISKELDLSPLMALFGQDGVTPFLSLTDVMDAKAATKEEKMVDIAAAGSFGLEFQDPEPGIVYHVPLRWDAITDRIVGTIQPVISAVEAFGDSAGQNAPDDILESVMGSLRKIRDEFGADPVLDIYVTQGNQLQQFELRIEEPEDRRSAADTEGKLLPTVRIGEKEIAPKGIRFLSIVGRMKQSFDQDQAYENVLIQTQTTVSNGAEENRNYSSSGLKRRVMLRENTLCAMEMVYFDQYSLYAEYDYPRILSISLRLSGSNVTLAVSDIRTENGTLKAAAKLTFQNGFKILQEMNGTLEIGPTGGSR